MTPSLYCAIEPASVTTHREAFRTTVTGLASTWKYDAARSLDEAVVGIVKTTVASILMALASAVNQFGGVATDIGQAVFTPAGDATSCDDARLAAATLGDVEL